jgi:hypothetical protein
LILEMEISHLAQRERRRHWTFLEGTHYKLLRGPIHSLTEEIPTYFLPRAALQSRTKASHFEMWPAREKKMKCSHIFLTRAHAYSIFFRFAGQEVKWLEAETSKRMVFF